MLYEIERCELDENCAPKYFYKGIGVKEAVRKYKVSEGDILRGRGVIEEIGSEEEEVHLLLVRDSLSWVKGFVESLTRAGFHLWMYRKTLELAGRSGSEENKR